MQAARDRQKSYADLKHKPMEFQIGDRVMLKVSPWKGVVRFGKRGKLNPRYVRPLKVLDKVGTVAYKLELPQELRRVHSTFLVSNLKKCHADKPLAVPLDGLHFDDKLHVMEEPIEIVDREVKQLKINLHTVRDDTLLGTLKFVYKTEDYQKYGALIPDGMINDDIKLSIAYKTYLDYATRKVPLKKARKFKKPASTNLKTVLVSPKEPTQKEVPDEPIGKTKDTSEGTGVKPGVPDVSKEDYSDIDYDSWGNSEDESDDVHNEEDNDDDDDNDDDSGTDDDGGNDAQDSERTNSNDDENPSFTLKDYDEEEQDEEYVHTPEKDKSENEEKMYKEEDDDIVKELYGDLNITQGLKNADMTNDKQGGADQQNTFHESGFVHEEEDAHVTLTTVDDKTKGPLQRSSVSSDFTSKLLNLNDPSPDINSLINISTVPPPLLPSILLHVLQQFLNKKHQIPQQQQLIQRYVSLIPGIVDNYLASKLKEEVNVAVQLQSNKLKEEAQAKNQEFLNQVDSTMKAIIKEQDEMIKKKIKTPLLDQTEGQNEGNQARMLSHRKVQSQKNQGHQAHPKSQRLSINHLISTISKARQPPRTFNELMGTTIDFSAYVMNRLKIDNLTQEILVGRGFNLLKGTCKSFTELEYHFEECYKAVNDTLDWNNPEVHAYPFDLSKPLPLIKDRGRQVVPANYFINNDLEYLKGVSSSRKYTGSTTRTKATKYDNIEGIEDMVPTLRSPVKVAYNKHAIWGTDDNVLYKFKEGDFLRLNLYDIEDMLLLLVQKKLFNLDIDDRYDLGVAPQMFTRRIVILHRVEDLQLGVESYQKKLNITKLETFRSEIPNIIPYTAYKNPQGILYQEKFQRNRLMRADELYKFYDETLSSVRTVLHDIASSLEIDYLPKRH
nr:putative reverse transcriptase domain-containing protein [Tanacetum cinerariifolium]